MQPSRIHHVGLPVSDLDLSVAWYREALGLAHEAAAGVPGVLPSWLRRPASGSNCSRSANTTLLTGDLAAAIGELKAKQAGELRVHGSGALIRWLLETTWSTRSTCSSSP